MKESEFDKFAEEYKELHAGNIKASGEGPEFFAEYKVKDAANIFFANGGMQTARILDYGAGVGTSVPHFLRYFPDAEITCLDVSQKSLDIGRERFQNKAVFRNFDGNTIPYPENHFDMIFVACVFHHIDHDLHLDILKEIKRVLKPDGFVIIFEHNPYNPLTLHAVNTCPFDENAVLISGPDFKRHLSQAGFSDVLLKYRIFFPGPLRFFRPLEGWMGWLPLGAQYYVVGR